MKPTDDDVKGIMQASAARAVEIDRLQLENDRMRLALYRAKNLCDKALPAFDWGKSPLTAEAIQLLNEVPGEIAAALSR